jgi:hypothetical protein
MKKVFLLLFAALFVALAAGAQGMPASPSDTSAQAGTGVNSTTTNRHHHRKHHKHHHRTNAH